MRNSKDSTLRLLTLLFVCCALAIWLSFGNPSASFAKLRAWAGVPGSATVVASQNNGISAEARQQIEALMAEKRSRTPAQRKLDSNLVFATKMKRGQRIAANVQTLEVPFDMNRDNVEVDISAKATDAVIKQITAGGGSVINTVARYGTVRARVAFGQLETLAELPDVIFIQPKQEFMTSRDVRREVGAPSPANGTSGAAVNPSRYTLSPSFPQRAERVRSKLSNLLATRTAAAFASPMAMFIGSTTSQGDATHKANLSRAVFGIDGTGVKIGVMSNGVVSLAASQALGDLGPVTVLPGQTGSGDEGTAMLELIHDLAPGAQLFFATANPTITQFAQNIRDLRTAGCDIIVDDVFYFVETPFQDGQLTPTATNGGVVIQAVNDVTAAGAMYFSSAGNSGNKNDNTSGVWEGNFVDGGAATGVLAGAGRVHDFGGGQLFNTLTVANTGGAPISLYWSDPLGASNNDYDLFRLNAAGTAIAAASTSDQSGTQDPIEQITQSTANPRIVIVLFSGASRFLHLNTNRGQLSISTNGTTRGHSHAANAFSVAATPSGPTRFNSTDAPGPFPGAFNSTNVLETFSSDGPRRIFYNADGTPITPGNVLATGGLLRQKPDITAADGSSVTGVGGFSNPFFGTSAAAPHAAAIAGLIKSAGPFTNAQIRTALTSTAIDIEGPGVDRDSGAGIIMALESLKFLNVPGFAFLTLGSVTVSEVVGNGNGVVEPGETGALTLPLTNVGVATATNVQAALSTTTPGITLIQAGPLNYGNIAPDATALNPTSYTFKAASNFPCNGTVNFTLTVTYGGGLSPSQTLGFPLQIFGAPLVITETLNPTPPVSGAIYTATGGTQNNRLNRNGVISSCAAPKATPGLQEVAPGAVRRFDAFTIANPSSSTQCITVQLSSACNAAAGSQLYLVAYNNNGFVPAAIMTNYLADWGVTTLGDQTISLNVPGNANFTLVVHEVTAGATNSNACPYTLTISGLLCPASPVCAPIIVNPASLSNGTIGTPYSATVTATSTVALPYVYSVTEGALPPGLTLNSSTGVISGTPNTVGTFNFRVTATSGSCSGFRDYSLTVACPTTTLNPSSLPAGTTGNAYSQTLSVTPAGTYIFSLAGGSLPSGFTLNSSTGVISGTTAATGTYTFTVTAQAANGCSTSRAYTLVIGCPTITVNPATLPSGTTGTAYSQTLTASPAGGNYTYSVSGSLPSGLNLNSSTGSLSGTPTTNGSFTFTVTATGWGGCSGSRQYTVVIGGGGCATITLPSSQPNGSVGALYNNSAAASPAGSYIYTSSGTLPPGVTLFGSVGLLFGYPTTPGSYTFTITATAGACSGNQQYTVLIGAGSASSLTAFSDFDGDGKSDLSVFRGSDGNWLSVNSGNGQLRSTAWGSSAAPYFDLTVSGDYDGDGKTDLAVFRRGGDMAGYWFIKRSRDGQMTSHFWGLPTDIPVPGDYDGDGKTDVAVWRGSAGAWYIMRSSNGGIDAITWGSASVSDVPVPGDYDGDGKADVAVFRQSTGDWYIKRSSDGSTQSMKWGVGTDVAVPGDYDGDGKTDLAVWRASEGNWYIIESSSAALRTVSLGVAGDVPVVADYDGDGKADAAVWRASTGTWSVKRSSDAAMTSKSHGQNGDTPVMARRSI